MSSVRRLNRVILATFLSGCGGSGDPGTTNPGGTQNPPAATTATLTIQMNTTGGTMWPGTVYGRDSTVALTRKDMTFQYGRCSGLEPGNKTCTYLVKVGQTVTLAATDVQAGLSASENTFATDRPDPRTIHSQFASWSAPCATPERGVCVLKVTGNQTVAVQYKSLSLTTVLFSGGPPYRVTLTAPPALDLSFANTATQNLVIGRPPFCTSLAPGRQCLQIMTPDNATIKLEAVPISGPPPMGAIGPTLFVGWGGACAINLTNPTCNLTSGIDQSVTMKWEHYRCVGSNGVAFPVIGVNGNYKYPAGVDNLKDCVLVSS